MTMMRASTCDVASRTSFDSSGDEDGRESVLWDQADGAAHRAAHRGNRSVGYLGVEGHGLERTSRFNRGGSKMSNGGTKGVRFLCGLLQQ